MFCNISYFFYATIIKKKNYSFIQTGLSLTFFDLQYYSIRCVRVLIVSVPLTLVEELLFHLSDLVLIYILLARQRANLLPPANFVQSRCYDKAYEKVYDKPYHKRCSVALEHKQWRQGERSLLRQAEASLLHHVQLRTKMTRPRVFLGHRNNNDYDEFIVVFWFPAHKSNQTFHSNSWTWCSIYYQTNFRIV